MKPQSLKEHIKAVRDSQRKIEPEDIRVRKKIRILDSDMIRNDEQATYLFKELANYSLFPKSGKCLTLGCGSNLVMACCPITKYPSGIMFKCQKCPAYDSVLK